MVVGAEERLVIECLRTLLETAGDHDVDVRVTLNEPNPAFASELAGRFPLISIIENPAVRGFAENHNKALADTEADVYLLANDDLEFQPACVGRVLDFMLDAGNDDVGSVSPKLLNTDGSLQRSTYRFPTVFRALLDLSGVRAWIPHNDLTDTIARVVGRGRGRSRFWSHDRTCDVDTFRAAAMFVRPAAWAQVGPLSEFTRVGGETGEWHRRCKNAGWRVVFFPEAAAIHHGSRTVRRNRLLQSEYLKGYIVYFARHRSPANLLTFRTGGLLISVFRLCAAAIAGDREGIQLWRTNLSLLARGSHFEVS